MRPLPDFFPRHTLEERTNSLSEDSPRFPTAPGEISRQKRSMSTTSRPNRLSEKARFDRLAAEWKSFESPSSSAMDLAMHPAYQQIIGMGPIAIPWVVEELKKEPDHWFWALHCLSGGADPVPVEDRGDLEAMSAAWIKWAKENGYRP